MQDIGSFGVWIQRVLQHPLQGGCSIPLSVWQTLNSGPTQRVFKKTKQTKTLKQDQKQKTAISYLQVFLFRLKKVFHQSLG